MIAALSFHNLWVWAAQTFIVTSIGMLLPVLFRMRHPQSRLIYYRLLLAAILLLPVVQPMQHEVFTIANMQVPLTGEVTPATQGAGVATSWSWSYAVATALLAGFI